MRALVLVLAITWAAPAGAVSVASKCNAAKFKATGVYVQRILGCQAKAIQKGGGIDHDCVARAAAKLEKAFANAEKKDDCEGSDPASTAQSYGDAFRIDLIGLLPPQTCCQRSSGGTDQCFFRVSDAECTSLGYTPGPPGSVCDGTTGLCATTSSPSSGPCCENDGICYAGGIAPGECTGPTATQVEGICLQTGECLPH
jgi:hypothetical protein